MKSKYNVVIVGGGPAGSMAALECAKAGLNVCLFEKTSRIGSRVRCGEAMSRNALNYFFNIKEDWVSREISHCNINSPSGIKLLPTDVKVDTPLTSNLLVVVTPVILTPNWSMTLTSVPSSSSRVILSPAILKSPTVSLI